MATFFIVIAVILTAEIYEASELPETFLPTPELIKYWGYPAETHEAVTSDGYILTLHRIPYGKLNSTVDETNPRPVFYLQHPFLSSSSDWVINLPNQSLGFLLADRGFDVWLGNVRGNRYSKKHVSLDVSGKAFWEFSFDEHAKYDFPAMIRYILNKTSQAQLHYVGHSQGTIMAFAALSEDQELQSKIKVYFALAPVSRVVHVRKDMKRMGTWEKKLAFFFKLFDIREVAPFSERASRFWAKLCSWGPSVCRTYIEAIAGKERKHLNETRFPVLFSHGFSGTSAKNILHYLQVIGSIRFRKYDYGEQGNLKRYNLKVPPEYDITKVQTPTVVVYGGLDIVATPGDAKWTIQHLGNVIKHFEVVDYNHADFLWAMNADEVLHRKIIHIARTSEDDHRISIYITKL